MTNKPTGEVLQTDELRAVALAWVKDSTSDPNDYLTKEGMAYINGFTQANNSIALIKKEKYDELLNKFDDLIKKYEEQNEECKIYKETIDTYKETLSVANKQLEEFKEAQEQERIINKDMFRDAGIANETLRQEANKYRNLYENRFILIKFIKKFHH